MDENPTTDARGADAGMINGPMEWLVAFLIIVVVLKVNHLVMCVHVCTALVVPY